MNLVSRALTSLRSKMTLDEYLLFIILFFFLTILLFFIKFYFLRKK